MIYSKEVCGTFTKLRAVTVEDAELILALRTNSEINRFLNKTEDNLSLQIEWIQHQQKKVGDYYFAICNEENQAVGVIGLYNIDEEQGTGEMGRYVCATAPIQAWEGMTLIHDFGFDVLGLNKIYYRVLSENSKAIAITQRFGSELAGYGHLAGDGEKYNEYEVLREKYPELHEKNMKRLLASSKKLTTRNRGKSYEK